jgi:adenosylcobyric acid synthase
LRALHPELFTVHLRALHPELFTVPSLLMIGYGGVMLDFGHGGNIKKLAESAGPAGQDLLDFSANINPLGPPSWLRPLIQSQIDSLVHYPDPACTELIGAIVRHYQVKEEEVLVGNGTTELIYQIPRVIDLNRAVIALPSYRDYVLAAEQAGMAVEKIDLKEEDDFRPDLSLLEARFNDGCLVVLGQPNNPTGITFDADVVRQMARRNPSCLFMVDEAFADFIGGLDSLTRNRPSNVIVLRSFTKFFAIPGLRLGWALADTEIARKVRHLLPPWSVNTLAQKVGEAALGDRTYAEQTRALVKQLRKDLQEALHSLPGLKVYPGESNFLLIRIDHKNTNAPRLASQLLPQGIAIRVCENFEGLDSRFFRVAVRTGEENERLCQALSLALAGKTKTLNTKRKTPAIMFQGTSSNAGKSILTAALCRILLQDGYRVAPFKSQNMSLNSFVTRQGGEMGRAQVVQAQACRLEPDVRMNPILLKPNKDTGSQVIVMGQPVGNMDVDRYIEYKTQAFQKAREAYDALAGEYEVIVLEGAGSPAEVNLKHHDIVNMRMAKYADATVLLVGDIDRGGVFASFLGTWEILAPWERKLLAGFVINRFRGDESLLGPAIQYTEHCTARPVWGVVPYIPDLGLPEEDSVSFKNGLFDAQPSREEGIEIAVIDLPHISNFTDFDSFRIEPDVRLKIVRTASDLDHPDALILPGSKNVLGDLSFLRACGLDRKIADLAREGTTEVIGVCGGFQILGQEIADPHGIESDGQTLSGLGLMPIKTIMAREKTLTRVTADHLSSGLELFGYEIHHGLTEGNGLKPIIRRVGGEMIGLELPDHRVWGTYLHGLFDADPFRRWFIDRLRERRGLPAKGKIMACYNLEPALDRLAEIVRGSLKINDLYHLLGLK